VAEDAHRGGPVVTALGDTVNIAARLGSSAGPGELLVSQAAWDAARLGPADGRREVEISGRAGTLPVVATGPASEATAKVSIPQ
jgi:class 3 adenylate cyclase